MAGPGSEVSEPIAARATAVVHLEGSPDFLAVAGDALFVTNEPKDLVVRLDARTGEHRAGIAVLRPCGAPAVTPDRVWVASCRNRGVVGIGLRTSRVEVEASTGLADPEGEIVLAATEDALFVPSDPAGTLAKVDLVSGEIVERWRVKPGSHAVVSAFGSLWVTQTTSPGSTQRLEPASGQVIAEVETGDGPRFLAAGEGAVWTLNQGDGTVSRIDPKANRETARIVVGPKETGGDIATGHGFVWVRGKAALLSVIDPRSNAVVARYGPPAGSGAVRASREGLWVSAHDVNTLWLVPPTPLPSATRP